MGIRVEPPTKTISWMPENKLDFDQVLADFTVFVDAGITEGLLDWVEGATEEVGAELFETGTGDGGVEVDALEQGVNLDGGLGRAGEGSHCAFAGGAETSDRSL